MKDDELKHIRKFEDLSQEQLEQLTASQAIMLRERFDIDPNNQINNAEIQKEYDEIRKRIKEIEAKAIKKRKGRNDDPGPESV